jgi:hypothetical protein
MCTGELTYLDRNGQEIFNVAVTKIDAMVEPDGFGNGVWREAVAYVPVHPVILTITGI